MLDKKSSEEQRGAGGGNLSGLSAKKYSPRKSGRGAGGGDHSPKRNIVNEMMINSEGRLSQNEVDRRSSIQELTQALQKQQRLLFAQARKQIPLLQSSVSAIKDANAKASAYGSGL